MSRTNWRLSVLALLIVALCLQSACILRMPTGEEHPSVPEENTLILFDTGPMTLDPAISQEASSHVYVVQIFSGLVALDENMEPAGDIAERWEVSQNGQVYTFYLRPDARFHDGSSITASDFKYSWERACRPETGSPTAPTYLSDIVGVTEALAGEAQGIDGVKVIDDHTLEVTIDAPKAYFLARLTYPIAFVVDRVNVESGEEWWRQPNGSGPFTLKEWQEDELVLLQRNDLYYREKARLDYVAFFLRGGAGMQMYEKDEIDVTYVSVSNLERVMDEANPLHQELHVYPELSLTYVGFDITSAPFDNAKVRQAFCRAVDKERIVSQLLKDSVVAADRILPPEMPGCSREIQGLDYDLEQATALLDEAGYGDGVTLPTLVFSVPGEGGSVPDWLTSILWQWEQNLGAEIEIEQLESEAYSYRLDEEMEDMFFFGWVADYPDPQDFADVLFRSGILNNYGGYSNHEVDTLLDQAAAEQDSEARFELYRQAEQLIVSDAACVPLWFGKNYVLVKPYVTGYSLNALGIPQLADVSVQR
jgi:oligopeptide transport system substrate-binding protein